LRKLRIELLKKRPRQKASSFGFKIFLRQISDLLDFGATEATEADYKAPACLPAFDIHLNAV